MDVLISKQAGLDLDALDLLQPGLRAWGFLVGHKRGFRFVVERVYPSPAGQPVPSVSRLDALNRLWEGKLIGLFALRQAAVLKPDALGPYFYGKLVLDLRGPCGARTVKACVVDFDRRFYLSPIALAQRSKGGKS